jgi:predicted negative regulator of RcsB-dependent stress response
METEEEQVEQIKAWLKTNGMSIVLGVVIGVGGIGGYRYWQYVQETTAEQASVQFTKMIDALNESDDDSLETHANKLIQEYSDTEYALMAHLALAKQHVKQGEFDQAESSLQQIVGRAAQEPLAYLARTRLASVQLQKQQFDQALSTLSIDFPAVFTASVAELRGDIYASQGNASEAVNAYRSALEADPGPANGEFVQQKLDDLGSPG